MARIRGSWIARQILGRALLPHHVAGWIRRRRRHRRLPTVHGNTQLTLYSRMLPGDFLHYGYFDDPDIPPECVSFDDLYQAQLRYAEELLALVTRRDDPVLDVGSGMGGMLGLLASNGYDATGLTPDRFQVEHIRRAYPDIPVLECRFEDMPAGSHDGYFGTVIHSESIQYMKEDQVFDSVRRVLAPGGTWIVADYFREKLGGERSGWQWGSFRERLESEGFQMLHNRDITPNILPTLGFAHLLASRIGVPVVDFVVDKLEAKTPGVHYVLETIAERGREALMDNLETLDPRAFADRKRYVLMAMTRG